MSLSIHSNYASLLTQSNLTKTNRALGINQQRLGTGFRINSAADGPADLQKMERLKSLSSGYGVAIQNVSDASTMLQTGEASFQEMGDILTKMKDLATKAASSSNTTADSTALQHEFDGLGKELAAIMTNSSTNGEVMFGVDGDAGWFGKGALSFQVGPSSAESMEVDVSVAVKDLATQLTALSAAYKTPATAGTEITTGATAKTAIDNIIKATEAVTFLRGEFGSDVNRLVHTTNNLQNQKNSTDQMIGAIRDADFAGETAMQSKNSLLMQSGIMVLKQTSQMPQMVMSLLG